MADLFDYLLWRGDLSMEAVPPNAVDTLILSELSYIHFEGLVPGDFLHPVPLKVAAEAFAALPGLRLHSAGEPFVTYRLPGSTDPTATVLRVLRAYCDALPKEAPEKSEKKEDTAL